MSGMAARGLIGWSGMFRECLARFYRWSAQTDGYLALSTAQDTTF